MMPAPYPDRQGQIMGAAGATPAGGRGANIAPSQRDLTRTDDIQRELNKLRVLYGPNGETD